VTRGHEPELYVSAVLRLYLELPDAPPRARPYDRRLARQLNEQGVDLALVETALLLATARRSKRSPSAAPLGPIRSLYYFLPVIEELRRQPPPEGYLAYLRAARTDRSQPGGPTGDRPENVVFS
jgi:hypothetical protein